MEEPDAGTPLPRNLKAKKADFLFWLAIILRKIAKWTMPKKDFFQREKVVGKAINAITVGKYKYDRYITISGSQFHLFAAMNPKAKVFDMQHGVLYKHHPTFFGDNQRLLSQFFNPALNFIFLGRRLS